MVSSSHCGGPTGDLPAVSDVSETLPIDIATAAVDSFPETSVSPTHDAAAKRESYQNVGKTNPEENKTPSDSCDAPGKDHVKKDGDALEKDKNHEVSDEVFTPSDAEAS